MNTKTKITEAIVRTEMARLVAEAGKLSRSANNHIKKLIDFYAPFVTNQNHLEELTETIQEFIEKSKFQEALKIRNLFVSVTTPYTQNGKDVILRTEESRQGECIIQDYYVGRQRVMTSATAEDSFINRINKRVKKEKDKQMKKLEKKNNKRK